MRYLRFVIVLIVCFYGLNVFSQKQNPSLETIFLNPPQSAKPWVLWYWMHGAVSKEGITADLEGLHKNGIGGVYLACIYDTVAKIPYDKPARQLTPEWWSMVNHSLKECKRLGMKMSLHMSDGFALAGGPWITPEKSMQKLVWSKTYVKPTTSDTIYLEQPETKEDYYKDIAVFAYPANSYNAFSETVLIPSVTTSTGEKAAFLAFSGDDTKTFRNDTSCWIQYKYPKPFTLRSLKTHTGGNNYQSQRLKVLSSDNGIDFDTIMQLQSPRHGWQDTDEDYTFSIPTTTARYFRFAWTKVGSEAGSEDLDGAKWKPTLKIKGIYLSDEPVINQIETKNGSMWRIAENTNDKMVKNTDAVPFKNIINLTNKMDDQGNLIWIPPTKGDWVVVRIGHTSTGHTNATGGAAKGLECDKFDAATIKLHFDNWFGKVFTKTDTGLAKEILKTFYIDSWEAGSQNWNKNFADEFKKRRGYDLIPYLLVMTGTPVNNAATSEKILHDVRQTIAELVNDVFYVTLRKLSLEKGCDFMAENVSPTMVSDGLLHFKTVDYPTGEFWLNSPTHDKPNDMFDAISAAHIYGKNIVQSEAFTTLRMGWNEYPGNLKALGDRNFAMGINKMILHVTTHNPWLNRKPGMTLGGIGLFYQRDQTWFKQSKSWIDYMARVSSMLQMGKPVADVAVFIGEEVPRRSVLPDRLLNTLPGIFGKERVAREKERLTNTGQPLRTIPDGVSHSANMADPEDWTDALRGYKYDCFNPDALLKAKVKNGKVIFQSGAAYAILIFPGKLLMNPNSNLMSLPVLKKILELSKAGATIIIDKADKNAISFTESEKALQEAWSKLWRNKAHKLIATPYLQETFEQLGVSRDVDATANDKPIAWAHRKLIDAELFFISNPENVQRDLKLSFRVSGYEPEIYDPLTAAIYVAKNWEIKDGRTYIQLPLFASGSAFVVFRKKTVLTKNIENAAPSIQQLADISTNWGVQFDPAFGGPRKQMSFPRLISWSDHSDADIQYYSGTAIYKNAFAIPAINKDKPVYITIDSVFNIATVKINGVECGTIWTAPYRIDVSKALKQDVNTIEISVSNTWRNRLVADQKLPEDKRISWTAAPMDFIKGKPLLKAGIVGNVYVEQ